MKTVAILHYASPPTVGGVESTIAYHARALADRGYAVRVVSGSGTPFDPRIETRVDPLFGSTHPDVLRVKAELDAGQISAAYTDLRAKMRSALAEALRGIDVCIAHNVVSMNKNLPLTAALAELAAESPLRVIAYCHDLAAVNDQYRAELHAGAPWDYLRTPWPDTRYVTVSGARQSELADLLAVRAESITVIPGGVDPARFFGWTPTTERLAQSLRLLDADGLLLLPARITRRKNIGLALRILAALRMRSGRDYRLIVTGPPGPHNPTNPGYLGELLTLCRDLQIEEEAHFLYAHGDSPDAPLIPDDATIANLYQIADALLFPSQQEGFGIPILEAGLAGLSIFCADLPPLRETGESDAHYFDPVVGDPDVIAAQILAVLENSQTARLKIRARGRYRWDVLVRDYLLPLLEDSPQPQPFSDSPHP